jgi:WD40 repeat protein
MASLSTTRATKRGDPKFIRPVHAFGYARGRHSACAVPDREGDIQQHPRLAYIVGQQVALAKEEHGDLTFLQERDKNKVVSPTCLSYVRHNGCRYVACTSSMDCYIYCLDKPGRLGNVHFTLEDSQHDLSSCIMCPDSATLICFRQEGYVDAYDWKKGGVLLWRGNVGAKFHRMRACPFDSRRIAFCGVGGNFQIFRANSISEMVPLRQTLKRPLPPWDFQDMSWIGKDRLVLVGGGVIVLSPSSVVQKWGNGASTGNIHTAVSVVSGAPAQEGQRVGAFFVGDLGCVWEFVAKGATQDSDQYTIGRRFEISAGFTVCSLQWDGESSTILCGISNGSLGFLDIQANVNDDSPTRAFRTILREISPRGDTARCSCLSLSACSRRPLVASLMRCQGKNAAEWTELRMWNYVEVRPVLLEEFPGDEVVRVSGTVAGSPVNVALHPEGHSLVVAYSYAVCSNFIVSCTQMDTPGNADFEGIDSNRTNLKLRSDREILVKGVFRVAGRNENALNQTPISVLSFSDSGHVLAVATGSSIHILSYPQLSRLRFLEGHSAPITGLCWRGEGEDEVSSCDADGVILAWGHNAEGGAFRSQRSAQGRHLSAIATGPAAQVLGMAPTEGKENGVALLRWDDLSQEADAEFSLPHAAVLMSTARSVIITASAEGSLAAHDWGVPPQRLAFVALHSCCVAALEITSDGCYVFTAGSDDGAVFVCSIGTGTASPPQAGAGLVLAEESGIHHLAEQLASAAKEAQQQLEASKFTLSCLERSSERTLKEQEAVAAKKVRELEDNVEKLKSDIYSAQDWAAQQARMAKTDSEHHLKALGAQYERQLADRSENYSRMLLAFDDLTLAATEESKRWSARASEAAALATQEREAAVGSLKQDQVALNEYIAFIKLRYQQVIDGVQEEADRKVLLLESELIRVREEGTKALDASQQRTSEVRNELQGFKARLAEQGSREVDLTTELDDCRKQLMDLQGVLKKAESDALQRTQRISAWETLAESQKRELSNLNKLRQALTSEILDLRVDLTDKDERLARTKARLESAERLTQAGASEAAGLGAALREKTAAARSRASEMVKLRDALAQRENLLVSVAVRACALLSETRERGRWAEVKTKLESMLMPLCDRSLLPVQDSDPAFVEQVKQHRRMQDAIDELQDLLRAEARNSSKSNSLRMEENWELTEQLNAQRREIKFLQEECQRLQAEASATKGAETQTLLRPVLPTTHAQKTAPAFELGIGLEKLVLPSPSAAGRAATAGSRLRPTMHRRRSAPDLLAECKAKLQEAEASAEESALLARSYQLKYEQCVQQLHHSESKCAQAKMELKHQRALQTANEMMQTMT